MKHGCDNCKYRFFPATRSPCDICIRSGDKYSEWISPTNADRIRNMTDEELASVITNDWCEIVCSGTNHLCNDGICKQHVLKWLKEEAGEM